MGLIQEVVRLIKTYPSDATLIVLIRVRGGDFVYNEEEITVMIADIELCGKLGAQGVAIGILTQEGDIDMHNSQRLVTAAKNVGLSVTFHRAFDLTRDPMNSLEDIITLQCDRLLTSGQAASCFEGLEIIVALAKAARDRIQILPGGGVNGASLPLLVKALAGSGIREYHASARRPIPGKVPVEGINGEVKAQMGIDKRLVCDPRIVEELRSCCQY